MGMTQLAQGDRDAFQPVFQLVWPLVYRFARGLLPTDTDAQDVAQEAMLKVFAKAVYFDPQREALPWILGITFHESRTWKKKRLRRKEQSDDSQLLALHADSPSPEAHLISKNLQATLQETLGHLEQKDLDTLLAVCGELDRPDIPPATFRKRVQRALERLRLIWSKRHER
jgi:RNA polymerase sigma-70 factor (ECF subfamily)